MDAPDDARWMDAALAFARRGFGTTAPNPCVGALVVRDGVVVGRGVTASGGRPHGEPLALAEAGGSARGATLYVTLEPCSHIGRGRPCVEAIIAAGVGRVVVACRDPDPRVAGQGVAALRQAGLAVDVGLREAEARRGHVGHLRRVLDGRPAVTLKLAETADGFAAAPPGAPRLMITGAVANGWVHVARAMHDAILVGAGTVRADDPLLTIRLPGMAGRTPLRVVLDRDARLDPGSRLAGSVAQAPVLLLTGPDVDECRAARLRALGVDLQAVPLTTVGRLDLTASLEALAARGVTRLFCEGGPTLAASLLQADLVDEAVLLTGPTPIGGPRPSSPQTRMPQLPSATPLAPHPELVEGWQKAQRGAILRQAQDEGRSREASGLLALSASARALLDDGRRFRLAEDRALGTDRLRRYERSPACSPD